MDGFAQIIVGVLAFIGAYLGTKRIKRHLIDGYIEERVKKALTANEKVLSKIRDILSWLEHEYQVNQPISREDLDELVDECKYISKISEDAGKEVATISFLLYQIMKDLKPSYYVSFSSGGSAREVLTVSDVVGLVSYSLRVIADYCVQSSPIPFRTRLVKKSSIRFGLRKYLGDSKYYRLKHQPFGLTLKANSEVVVRFSSMLGKFSSPIFRVRLFSFLQDNYPLLYEMLVSKIYVPLRLSETNFQESLVGKTQLHLVKIKEIKGSSEGDRYLDCFYTNLAPWVNFVDGQSLASIRTSYCQDDFLDEEIDLANIQSADRRVLETVKYRIPLVDAKKAFQDHQWTIRWRMLKARYSHR